MRVDPVLTASVSRLRWALSHIVVAVGGTVAILIAFGLAAGLSYGLSSGNLGRAMGRIPLATLAYLPAILVMAAVVVALWGLLPRLAQLAWVVFVGCLLIDLLGELQQASQTVKNLSPFTHVPRVLVSEVSVAPLIWLTTVAVLLMIAGLLRFRHRDIG